MRKVQIEAPTFFLRFKGIFTEDELKEKEEERFKGVVEDMVEYMEMEDKKIKELVEEMRVAKWQAIELREQQLLSEMEEKEKGIFVCGILMLFWLLLQ